MIDPNPRTRLYFEGANPTADLILMRPSAQGPEVLLVVRSVHASACPGLAAFPGGFIESSSKADELHRACESKEEAARRELLEETGLDVGGVLVLNYLGAWKSKWRDPRNEANRFVLSHVFCAWVPEGFGPNPQGLDDTQPGCTAWIRLKDLEGQMLAFDHGVMLAAACARMGVEDPGAQSWALSWHWKSLGCRESHGDLEQKSSREWLKKSAP